LSTIHSEKGAGGFIRIVSRTTKSASG